MSAPTTVFSDVVIEPATDDDVPDFRASADASEAAGEADTSPSEDFSGLLSRATSRNGSRETPKDETPKGTRGRKVKEPKPEIPMPRTKDGFKPLIEQAYYGISTGVMFLDPEIANAIAAVAPDAAVALNELAKTNPKFRRFLNNMLQTSAVGAVLVAHIPLFIVIGQRMANADKPPVVGPYAVPDPPA